MTCLISTQYDWCAYQQPKEVFVDITTIQALYGYNQWVNERLLAAAETLPTEQTRQRFGASYDSIHGTLAHILGAEIVWLSRWQGTSPSKLPNAADFASIADIRVRWQEQQAAMTEFLAGLTPERLAAPVHYVNTAGQAFALPLWQLMLHLVNHGTHHRSELADMLTRAGHPPAPTDLLVYFLERSG